MAPPIGGWLADTSHSFTSTYVMAAITALIAAGATLLFRRNAPTGARAIREVDGVKIRFAEAGHEIETVDRSTRQL